MGRVYNALVRAERWKDADRPIGSPVRGDVEVRRTQVPPAVPSFNFDSPAIVPPAFEHDFAAPEEPVSQLTEGADFIVHASTRVASPRSMSSGSQATASEPLPAVFEEPIQVSSVKDLSIDPHLAAFTDQDPSASEVYRGLAVKLLSLADHRKLKTLLITSAEAAEGKTTVAAGVAWLLAKRSERRVLLIDATLAPASLARALGIEAKRGWVDLAGGSCSREQAIIRLDPNGLYVLTPGPRAQAQPAGELLPSLEKLITELAPRFDLVIVDSTPILASPETQRLAQMLGGTVIVARAGHTHHSKVTAARKLVPKERRLGIVLNESEVNITDRRRQRKSPGRLFGRKR